MTFFILTFCNKNVHECSSCLNAIPLKIWGQSSKNSLSYVVLHHTAFCCLQVHFFQNSKVQYNQLLQKTWQLFSFLFFCNKNLQKCSACLYALALKIWCQSELSKLSSSSLNVACCAPATTLSIQWGAISCVKHGNFFCGWSFAMKIYTNVLHILKHFFLKICVQ